MGLRLVTPMRRKDSANPQFVRRIPGELRGRLVGMRLEFPLGDSFHPVTITPQMQAVRFSLRTNDESEAVERQAEALAYWERLCRNLKATAPITLTPRQCEALAGELYRSWASDLDASRRVVLQNEADGSVTVVRGVDSIGQEAEAAAYLAEADKLGQMDGERYERHLGPLVDRLLLRRGIAAATPDSRELLLASFARALGEGMQARARKAQGDYRPDANAERFPEWSSPAATVPQVAAPVVSLPGLFDAWWLEAERAGKSVSAKESFGKAVHALAAFLGHDDAARVTPDDVVRFKDHLVAIVSPRTKRHLSTKTIGGSYLGGLKVVFGWAVQNGKLAANPAEKVMVAKAKRVRLRDPWFSPEERKAILEQASSTVRGRREPWQRFEGRRWVPWLCAYTGARVGEMVQLRKKDVRQAGEHWVLRITPEAGTVKVGGAREVPIHPHLIEMGFLKFVEAASDGFLFMWSGSGRAALRTAKNRLTQEVRKAAPDPNVQPNHGWRHTFKVVGGEAGIQDRTLDAICGHAPRTVGEGYGGVTIVAKVAALRQFPRFDAKPIASGS